MRITRPLVLLALVAAASTASTVAVLSPAAVPSASATPAAEGIRGLWITAVSGDGTKVVLPNPYSRSGTPSSIYDLTTGESESTLVGWFTIISDDFSATVSSEWWRDLRSGSSRAVPQLDEIELSTPIAMTRDGRSYLLSSPSDGQRAAIVDGASGRFTLLPITGQGVAMSPNGRFVLVSRSCASATCGTFRIDRTSGRITRVVRPEQGELLASDVADTGRIVIASGDFASTLTAVEATGARRTVVGTFPEAAWGAGTLTRDGALLLLKSPTYASRPHSELIRLEDGAVLATVAGGELPTSETAGGPVIKTMIARDGTRYFELVGSKFDSELSPLRRLEVFELDGGPLRAMRANETRRIQIRSMLSTQLASEGAVAAMLNVTVTDPRGDGFLTVWPCDGPRPLAANVNFAAGAITGSAVLTGLDAQGWVCVSANVDANVVVDAAGWFETLDVYRPVSPARLADTRRPGATTPGLASRTDLTVRAAGAGGIPEDAGAAMLSVIVVGPEADGFVTVWPCGEPRPLAANLNFRAGETRANTVLAKVGDAGTVCVWSNVATDVVVDASGSFAAGGPYEPINPTRLVDTRAGDVDATPNLAAAERVEIPGLPPDRVAALQVTVTNAAAAGFVTVWRCSDPRPLVSNLNFDAGQTVGNFVLQRSDGPMCAAANVPVDLVVDLQGSLGGEAYRSTTPERLLDTRP